MTGAERLTASAALARLADGSLSAEALVRACLDRAEAGAALEAWAFLDPERAVAQARAADRAGRPGLLKGVPVAIKDIIDTADMPTEHGSPIYRGNRPFADAAVVALIRAAGGVILGKTVTAEFANRHPGPTKNPHNPAHTPGGSSSGSAAAVADFHVPLALGTQTGGSVIRPAAFCGIVGYKPSFGDFSRAGVKMQSPTLDTIGLYARSLEDIALLRGVLMALPPEPVDRHAATPRIGFCRTPAWEEAEPSTQALLERTASRLAAAGAALREVGLPPPFDTILETHSRIFYFEAARNYAYEYEAHRELVSGVLRKTVLEPGRALPIEHYIEAVETTEAYRRHLDEVFGEVDVLLAPSTPGEAPKGLGSTGSARFNGLWTLAGTPCVTLPAGTGPQGLPIGVQLVGARGRDGALLDAAGWIEGHLG